MGGRGILVDHQWFCAEKKSRTQVENHYKRNHQWIRQLQDISTKYHSFLSRYTAVIREMKQQGIKLGVKYSTITRREITRPSLSEIKAEWMEKNNIHGKAQVFGNVIFPKTDLLTNIVRIQFFLVWDLGFCLFGFPILGGTVRKTSKNKNKNMHVHSCSKCTVTNAPRAVTGVRRLQGCDSGKNLRVPLMCKTPEKSVTEAWQCISRAKWIARGRHPTSLKYEVSFGSIKH